MNSKGAARVTIISDSSRLEQCEAQCGLDWASPEVVALAARRVEERFGDRVQLEYLDLSRPASGDTLGVSRLAGAEDLRLPLLVIDGRPRVWGQFDIRMLLDAIEAELEMIF